jgi:hypothetical protein
VIRARLAVAAASVVVAGLAARLSVELTGEVPIVTLFVMMSARR